MSESRRRLLEWNKAAAVVSSSCPVLKIEITCPPCGEAWDCVSVGPPKSIGEIFGPQIQGFSADPIALTKKFFEDQFLFHPHKELTVNVTEAPKDAKPHPPRKVAKSA